MISTSGSDDKKFGADFLKDIMEWIVLQFSIEDLFTENVIKEYVKEEMDFEPEDLFEDDALGKWAEENGWRKEND